MTSAALRDLILGAVRQRVLCIGDVMLDDFVHGSVSRISPEAPVPVLRQEREEKMPGGAGNTARNLAALGARTRLIGAIGKDTAGDTLQALLAGTPGIDTLLIQSDRLTTVRKTRFVSGGQQLLRVDREPLPVLDSATETELVDALREAAIGASAIVVSDYAKGTVTGAVMREAVRAGLAAGMPVIVDPKGTDLSHYGPVDLIKPNAAELASITGLPTGTNEEVERALLKAMTVCSARAILVTRAAKGLSYLERGGTVRHMAGRAREVYDVSGAGDTSLAALGIALSSGASLELASQFALAASGLAVSKAGTATVSAADLLGGDTAALLSVDMLMDEVAVWRAAGLKVGFTNGCFDILHRGHLRVLEEARARCDRLVVGLNTDVSVRRLKGEGRPVNPEDARAELLAALSVVDAVVLFDDETPIDLVRAIRPDLIVKGGDYTPDTVVGADIVLEGGGEVHIVPLLEGQSTTGILARLGAKAGSGEAY